MKPDQRGSRPSSETGTPVPPHGWPGQGAAYVAGTASLPPGVRDVTPGAATRRPCGCGQREEPPRTPLHPSFELPHLDLGRFTSLYAGGWGGTLCPPGFIPSSLYFSGTHTFTAEDDACIDSLIGEITRDPAFISLWRNFHDYAFTGGCKPDEARRRNNEYIEQYLARLTSDICRKCTGIPDELAHWVALQTVGPYGIWGSPACDGTTYRANYGSAGLYGSGPRRVWWEIPTCLPTRFFPVEGFGVGRFPALPGA